MSTRLILCLVVFLGGAGGTLAAEPLPQLAVSDNGRHQWTPPTNGRGQDWLLVVQ